MDQDKDQLGADDTAGQQPGGAPPLADTPTAPAEDTHAVEPSLARGDSTEATDETPDPEAPAAPKAPGQRFARLKAFAHSYWARKRWTVPVTVIGLLVLLLAVPFTRYSLLGLVWKKDVSVMVLDSATAQPVTGATVTAAGATAQTDNRGVAKLHVGVGGHAMTVSKKYYKTYNGQLSSNMFGQSATSANVVATGRQVPITVTDYITGKPIENAVLKSAGTTAKTDAKGKATLVLPTGQETQDATIDRPGYNTQKINVLVTSREVTTNKFTLTPAGKLYFLSNQSGTIDVVKTDLDGKNRKPVLIGTGKEDSYSTSLLASRDWKYLALLSKRDGQQGLYIIDTSTDKATNVDGGGAQITFTLVGWSGDTFVYQSNHSNVSTWQSGGSVLKSYDASASKLYNLDQTTGEGSSQYDYGSTSFSTVSLLNGEVVYTKNWGSSQSPNHLTGKSDSLVSVKPDGSNKHSVKDFPIPDGTQFYYGVNLAQYEPYSLYVQVPNSNGTNSYYEYENGTVNAKSSVNDDTFGKQYPTYLISPSGRQTFWTDIRDNKNTLFIGNSDGQNSKQIATLSDYTPYGWYTDNYLLVSKNGSELYAMSTDGSKQPVKITDYYKPQLTYKGYGGGYGGL